MNEYLNMLRADQNLRHTNQFVQLLWPKGVDPADEKFLGVPSSRYTYTLHRQQMATTCPIVPNRGMSSRPTLFTSLSPRLWNTCTQSNWFVCRRFWSNQKELVETIVESRE